MPTAFPIFTLFFIFVISISFHISRLEKNRAKRDADFWAREKAAKKAPGVDLSSVPFIEVPLDTFSFGLLGTEESEITEDALSTLATKPILNLNGMTNTDIRLAYGADNFDYMQAVGENFDELEILLCDYAKLLIEQGHHDAAIPVLSFAVSNGATISAIYTLLGECYDATDAQDELAALITIVEERDLLMKPGILDHLRGLLV